MTSKTRSRSVLTDAQKVEIRKLINALVPYQQIARRYNVSITMIYNISKKMPERTKGMRRRKITEEIAIKTIKMIAETDLTFKEIGDHLNISRASVSSIARGTMYPDLDRSKITRTRHTQRSYKGRITKELAQEIYDKYKSGVSQKVLGLEYNMARGFISRICTGYVYDDIGNKENRYSRHRNPMASKPTGVMSSINYLNIMKDKEARRKKMKYNKYGLLVPIDQPV